MPDVVQDRCETLVAAGAASASLRRAGARIANSRGVPGTLGCIVRSLADGRPLLLSAWHVLFGRRARKHEIVWLVEESDSGRRFLEIGRVLYGHVGAIRFGGEAHFVDCAVAYCSGAQKSPRESMPLSRGEAFPLLLGETGVEPGCLVKKTGAATGATAGEVVDVKYSTTATSGVHPCLRQLLIRPKEGCPVFAAEGDSGALVTDSHSRAVGLLWGSTSRGEGIACPIAPVLHALNIALRGPA